jgi:hypothetical protein
MKSKLLILSLVLAGSLAFQSAGAQVRLTVTENDYPGYTYYSYPAWHGHDRDRAYYAHYHLRFQREHRSYFTGHRFDHDRYDRDRRAHGR